MGAQLLVKPDFVQLGAARGHSAAGLFTLDCSGAQLFAKLDFDHPGAQLGARVGKS